MPSFPESDLVFKFPDDWIVRKFDDTPAYQSLSGHGLKGVDFIALSPDGQLWLIEVKNYRPRYKNDQEYFAKRRTPTSLSEQVWNKFKDSHRLMAIVMASMERIWWFPIWKWYRSKFIDPASNRWFWLEAKRRSDAGLSCYVLWLETPETSDDYSIEVAEQLKNALPDGAKLRVIEADNKQDIPFGVAQQF